MHSAESIRTPAHHFSTCGLRAAVGGDGRVGVSGTRGYFVELDGAAEMTEEEFHPITSSSLSEMAEMTEEELL
jgi:hypothetical protein